MSAAPRRLRFEGFELRLDSGELLRAGSLVKLQPQPAKILEILAGRSGEVVSREEIRQLVWGDSAVDFDASLNFCIKEIRRVLGDSATSPTFVETVPRRGYRFLKPVAVEPSEPRRRPRPGEIGLAGTLVGLLLLLTFLVGSRLRPASPRLAVLPLDCRSRDLADQQVCGGITEALTAELTRRTSPDLDVIAPLSALVYDKKKPSEIARGLRTTAVLTGEALPSAQGLRLTVWLTRSGDGKELWRESFDAELKDAPLVYGQIARGVARTLDLRIPPVAKSPAASHRPSPPAYEAYLRGIYFRRHDQYYKAAAALQDATLIDPGFAPAFAELALARIATSSPTEPGIEAVEAAARRALALDANLAEAHIALGKLLYIHYLDWRGAGRELRMAVALDPGNAYAHHEHSIYLVALGRHAEALAAVGRARELDPASMFVGSDYAWYFYLDHRYEEAIRQTRSVLDLFPLVESTSPPEYKLAALDIQLNSAWKLGDREAALGAAKEILRILNRPRFPPDRLSSPEEFWRGREVRIQRLLAKGEADPFDQARNAIHLGEPGRALDLLTRDCAPRGLTLPFAAVEPLFDSLHSDPRWSRVLDCLKLPADAPARKSRP